MKEWPDKGNENKYQRKDRDSFTAALVKPSRNESVSPSRGRRSLGCKRKKGRLPEDLEGF